MISPLNHSPNPSSPSPTKTILLPQFALFQNLHSSSTITAEYLFPGSKVT